jgi:hypothetical protein
MQSERDRSIAVIKRNRGRGHTARPSDCKLTAIAPLPLFQGTHAAADRAGRRLDQRHHLQGPPVSSTVTASPAPACSAHRLASRRARVAAARFTRHTGPNHLVAQQNRQALPR